MIFTFYKKLRNKIAYRLLLYILLFSGVVTVIITTTQLYIEYQRDIDAIDDQFNRIETIFQKPLIEALWFFNENSIRLQLEGIYNLRDIEYLELVGEGNISIIVGQKVSKYTIKNHLPLIYTGKNINREIGSLTIVASMAWVYSRLFDRLITILISQSVKTFLVSTFIFLIFHFLVVRHISSIGNYLKKFSFKVRPQLLELKRKSTSLGDELDQTVSSINEMAANLYKSYETIDSELLRRREAEKKLQKGYDELEQIVAQRTKSLKEERDRAQNYLDIAGVMLVAIDTDQKVVLINKKGCEILGYNEREIIGKNWFDNFLYADDKESVKGGFDQLMSGDIEYVEYVEKNIRNKNGQARFIAWHNTLLKDEEGNIIGTLSSGEDITEQKEAEKKIKASLEEKEVLLREIHHRVKNNMQVITSLLRLQFDKIKDQQYADMFQESQERIKSMALIHEKLYQSRDLTRIDFSEYIKSLINSLFRSYGIDTDRIVTKLNVEDVSLGLDHAIPCGLIINELVSNSIKYAFPQDREGKIEVALRSINEDELELTVSDNGTGIPEDLDIRNTDSLGLELVAILAEDQLEGKIYLDRTGGTTFRILFKGQI